MDLTKSNHIVNIKNYLDRINTINYNENPNKTLAIIIDLYKYIYYYCNEFIMRNNKFKKTILDKIPSLKKDIDNHNKKPKDIIYKNFIIISKLVLEKYT